MDWLEQNLDAYRIVGEILNDLRRTLQEGLRKIHGAEWYRSGLPTEVFDRLVSTKEGETAIGWYEPEYQEIMDYAVFEDLLAILEHNRAHFPSLVGIVPNPSLFAARFLELESLRKKISRARPVSDAELTFLTRFLQRFRESLNDHHGNGAKGTSDPPHGVEAPKVEAETVAPPVQIKPEQPAAKKPAKKIGQEPVVPPPPADTNPVAGETPPARPPQRLQPVAVPDKKVEVDTRRIDNQTSPAADAEPATLITAIEKMDTKAILRELFREVTTVAESLWSTDVLPVPVVWKSVRTSTWYEQNYSSLGLKPLSDFFSVIAEVERRMGSGLAKHELQALLEENNFAQVLLALRDMFQRNKI